jgi:hypothetical protein
MESAIAILVIVAAVVMVGGVVTWRLWRRRRVERAQLLSTWAELLAAVAQRPWNEPPGAPDVERLGGLERELLEQRTLGDDVRTFLHRGSLDKRVCDTRAAHALVAGLPREKLRAASDELETLPRSLRVALGPDVSANLEAVSRELAEWPALVDAPSDPPSRTRDRCPPEVAVKYVELVQDAAVRANNTAGRLYLLRMVLTVIVLALALGLAKTGEKVDIFGLGLELKPWVLLVAGSIVASVMQIFDVPYYERGHQLGWRAARLYDELGYPVPRDEWVTPENPLALPYAAAMTNDPLFRKLSYNAASVGGQVVGGLFLVGTQVYVLIKLANLGYEPVPLCIFALLPILTAAIGIAKFILIRNEHRRGERPWSGQPSHRRAASVGREQRSAAAE